MRWLRTAPAKPRNLTLSAVAPVPIELTAKYKRRPRHGVRSASGVRRMADDGIRRINNAEDTLQSERRRLHVDKWAAPFREIDGTPAPYKGSDEFNGVSLKLIDERTIEESDLNDGKVGKISRWALSPDGQSIHVRFDDLHGRIQEQDGHKVK